MAAMKQLGWGVVVCGLVATASADSGAVTKAADGWVAAVMADKPVAIGKDRPVAFWTEVPSTTACEAGKLTTAADVKKLGSCLRELAKRFGLPDGYGHGEVVKLSAVTQGLEASEKKAIVAAAKGATFVEYGGNGDGETLLLYVAVAKDGTVKAVVANAEAAE